MPGTARKSTRSSAVKAVEELPEETPATPVDELPEQAPVSDAVPNAEEQAASAQGAPAPVDFMALLSVAEDDTKASAKSDERATIQVPEEWIAKVKDTFENRRRVRIPGITSKEIYAQVGDLIRAAADRIEKTATVRAVYSVPEGKENTKENRVLSALSFTVGPRREGPRAKKGDAVSDSGVGEATDVSAPDTASVSDNGADSAPQSE
jgi:hypothetical protein